MELENKDVVDRRVRRHRAEMVGERCRGREEAIKKTAVMSFVEKNRGLWRLRVFVVDQECWPQVFVVDEDGGESWLLQVFVDDKSCWLQAGGCECLLTIKIVGSKCVC